MHQILESYVRDFREKFDLERVRDSVAFEYFASHCVFRNNPRPPDDYDFEDITCGDATGVDAIAVFVNERFTESVDALEAVADRRLSVAFNFVQAKRTSSFDLGDMLKFFSAVERFFTERDADSIKDLEKWFLIKERVFALAGRFSENPQLNLYYVTTGTWTKEPTLASNIEVAKARLQAMRLFSQINIVMVDGDDLTSMYRSIVTQVARAINMDKCAIVPKIAGVRQAFIGVLPASEYIKLISGEDGQILRHLFYDNVRDFQGENPVNREITETLIGDPTGAERFVLLNNGVTIVAREVRQTGTEFQIRDFQIVNGCQTSYVLHGNRSNLKGTEFLSVKLIETDDLEIANQITKATNRQTKVELEAFASLQPFHKELEAFYGSFPKEGRLYYERRSRQFAHDPAIQRSSVVTVPNQIKAFVSIVLGEPHKIHYYYGQLLNSYSAGKSRRLFADNHALFPYYFSSWLSMTLKPHMEESGVPSAWRYHVLLLVRCLVGGQFDLSRLIDAKYCEKYFQAVISELRNPETVKARIAAAWTLIRECAGADVPEYNLTRSEEFSSQLTRAALIASPTVARRPPEIEVDSGSQFIGVVQTFVADRGFGYVAYGQRRFQFEGKDAERVNPGDVGRRVRFRMDVSTEPPTAVELVFLQPASE